MQCSSAEKPYDWLSLCEFPHTVSTGLIRHSHARSCMHARLQTNTKHAAMPNLQVMSALCKAAKVNLKSSAAGHPQTTTSALTPTIPTPFPHFGPIQLKPSNIFFTHDSILSKFRDGRLVRETLRQLRAGDIQPDAIPTMKVCHHAAAGYPIRFWTYTGNRRLWVFRQLEEEGLIKEVGVQFVNKIVPAFRLTTRNGGVSLRIRGE